MKTVNKAIGISVLAVSFLCAYGCGHANDGATDHTTGYVNRITANIDSADTLLAIRSELSQVADRSFRDALIAAVSDSSMRVRATVLTLVELPDDIAHELLYNPQPGLAEEVARCYAVMNDSVASVALRDAVKKGFSSMDIPSQADFIQQSGTAVEAAACIEPSDSLLVMELRRRYALSPDTLALFNATLSHKGITL